MKKGMINGVLFVLFIILAGIYLMIKIKPIQESDKIFGAGIDGIVDINISLKDEQIAFSKKDNRWVMIKPGKYRIDEKKMDKLENILKNLSFERLIEKDAADLIAYGLDKPAPAIQIRSENGREMALFVGAETVSGTHYYAARNIDKSARNEVFMVGKAYVDILSAGSNAYRAGNFLAVNMERLEEFHFLRDSGEELHFERNRNTGNQWKLTVPVKADIRSDAFVEILRNIGRLEIEEYIRLNDDALIKYGLKKPLYKLDLKDGDGRVQSLLSGKSLDNKMYIMTDNSEEIYGVPENVFNPGDIRLNGLLDVAPLSVSIDKVNKLIINDSGSIHEFGRSKSGLGDGFLLNGQKISNEHFITLYINIMALSAEGYDNSGYVMKPDLTITLDTKDAAGGIKAGFTKRTIDTCFMSVNDVPLPYYINKNKIELVRSWIRRILISG